MNGKVALVTGAGSGIGRAVSVRLAEAGAEVVVSSPTPAHLDETAGQVEAACGRRPLSFPLDVRDRAAVEEVVAEVVARHGGIDVLSNNGGVDLAHGPALVETTDEEWERVHSARGLYGNAGSYWARWYHEAGVGPLAEAGIYNLKSLTSLLGPVVEVHAAEATAVPRRFVGARRSRIRIPMSRT